MIDIEGKKGISEQELMENVSAQSIVEVQGKWAETNDDRSILCVVIDEHGKVGVLQNKPDERLITSIVLAACSDEKIEFTLRKAVEALDTIKQVLE